MTISFNLKTGVSLGTAVDKVTALAAQGPAEEHHRGFSGNAQMFQESMQNLTLLLIVAIGVVYIVLGVLYESYIHPITILSGLPSAGVGALLTLILFKNELNIYSFVGLIMLVGIVKKNAIMQIDFALEAERKHGKTPAEAIYEGCLIRFRPIMMTTMAAHAGRGAAGAGLRRRRRGAPSAGPGGGGRAVVLAVDDFVSDAGGVHLPGERCGLVPDAQERRRPGAARGVWGLMNLSEPFIQRPIATSLLMAAIALFGTVAYRALPVSDLPNVDFPTLQVTASLPGASPETMASAVATPLENQFSTIAGLIAMTSVNSLGSTLITLEFDLNRSLDGAAVDTQAAITQASKLLPNNMPTPPTFTKVNPADQPIIFVALKSKMVPLYTLGRMGRDAPGAAHLHHQRRRAGAGAGRSRNTRCTCRLDPRRAGFAPGGHQRSGDGAAKLEREPAHRPDHRTAAGVHAAGQRPVDVGRRVQNPDRGLPQRQSRAAERYSA